MLSFHPGSSLLPYFPHLKKQLKMAGMKQQPAQVLDRAMKNGLLYGVCMAIFSFFMISRARGNLLLMIPVFAAFFIFFFMLEPLKVRSAISRRRYEIDQEVIFIGRYLLIKLHSGRPLLNALAETAKSKGVTAAYVREIVHEISTGTPLETALKNAVEYCPSEKFAKILFQLNNSLKIGIDVSQVLESILEEISNNQLIELQRYGKKLNSFTLFYMLTAVVVPSLGITMLIIVSSFVSIKIDNTIFFVLLFFLIVFELFFISLFKSVRPRLNL